MMFKKGQAAMEFLMTYGWAILVVLIAIGVLIFLVGNPSNLVGDRIGTPFNCGTSLTADAGVDGTVTFELTNGLSNSVTIVGANDIALTGSAYSAACIDSTIDGVATTDSVINAGQTVTIVITCTGQAFTAGDKVKSPFQITYTDNSNAAILTGLIKTGDITVSVK